MLESLYHAIVLKSSLSYRILKSMCVVNCILSIKVVLSPLSRSTFLYVTPIFLSCCLPYYPRDAIPLSLLAIQSRPSPKSLNIVFDLNNVLCKYVDRLVAVQHRRTFCKDQLLYSLQILTLVALKGINCHPPMLEFLHFISNFVACIII